MLRGFFGLETGGPGKEDSRAGFIIRKGRLMEQIEETVHKLYWEEDKNCARTMLTCLCRLYGVELEPQVENAAIGLHGAGGYRAQCGLVEGGLMFLGIYLQKLGKSEAEIVKACYRYAEAFERQFGSLRCHDLRPTGFSTNDPPHMCEGLTVKAVEFAHQYVKGQAV